MKMFYRLSTELTSPIIRNVGFKSLHGCRLLLFRNKTVSGGREGRPQTVVSGSTYTHTQKGVGACGSEIF